MANTPLIISCPVVGAELTRETYPHLPITPEEIAQSAKEAVEAGATIIHLHVRDKDGNPSQDVGIFEETTKKIRERCDCILQYSTGGAVGTDLAGRCAPLTLKPEMGTLSMGTMNFGDDVFTNDEETIVTIGKALVDNGVMPELEIFDYGMMETMFRYLKKGMIPSKFHVDFVLGVPGGMMGDINSLNMLVNRLPEGQTWCVAGVGRFQLPATAHAIAMGGHVRVGIEDNIFYRKGEMATSNAQLVARAVRISKELDRPIATLAQAKEMLSIS
jgi:3-keto-5-aminohexanoate cleavage enzyme